jgi:predicted PurR-regulated permease PerM
VLGLLAGCTVLLPLIGPISSAILTLVVCLAVGGTNTSMLMLVAVIATYVIITGIFDQLFIYPSVIGEALGLTTLETIIVVLLGGFFAGLTGMIFAVPTAAILKYLIPQIYNCWK